MEDKILTGGKPSIRCTTVASSIATSVPYYRAVSSFNSSYACCESFDKLLRQVYIRQPASRQQILHALQKCNSHLLTVSTSVDFHAARLVFQVKLLFSRLHSHAQGECFCLSALRSVLLAAQFLHGQQTLDGS